MPVLLIGDDGLAFQLALRARLVKDGYRTLTALDAAEAWVIARDPRADVVLLDLAVPEVEGPAFLRRLREDPVLADTPVVVVARARGPLAAEAARMGPRCRLLTSTPGANDMAAHVVAVLPRATRAAA